MLVELRRDGGALWIIPEGWADPPTPMRSASTPVMGGMLAAAPDASRAGLPLALITDLKAACWWIEDVYGEAVLDAVTDDVAHTSVAATPGPVAEAMISLIQALWLRRWWYPRGEEPLDIELLDAEIGALQVAAATCFESDALAESRLSAGLGGILRLPQRIAGVTGTKRRFLDEHLRLLADAAERFVDPDHPLYPHLHKLVQQLGEHDELSAQYLSELERHAKRLTAPPRKVAHHAGADAIIPDQHFSTTVDWLQVPARSVSGLHANVFAWIAGDQISVTVEPGPDPVPKLIALAYADNDVFPARILTLAHETDDYRGVDTWENDVTLSSVHILQAPLLDETSYTPRPLEIAEADRDYVRRLIAGRANELDTSSLVSEVLQ